MTSCYSRLELTAVDCKNNDDYKVVVHIYIHRMIIMKTLCFRHTYNLMRASLEERR